MSAVADRAAGVLLGAAAGDALGVPYEYGSRPLVGEPAMLGGGLGGYAPGQWSDDTEMSCVIARVAATGADLRTPDALDAIADGFLAWFATAPADVGIQTRRVLTGLAPGPGSAARMRAAAARVHEETGRTAGNGSLMRTAPVALAHLGDPDAIVEAAHAVSALTHHDPVAGEACVLWCLAIDRAVRTGELDVGSGLSRVDPQWTVWLDRAAGLRPGAWAVGNGWVVAALLGARSAVEGAVTLPDGLVAAVGGGGDTDTVAAIAGALLGGRFGGAAVPERWRHEVHGWPGLGGEDLVALAGRIVSGS
ncbi:ADP-ribosylglycohydrolase family protein [Pseudonocardia sp. ICBG601]|uniref:ADP-ribosylglycohydrolase family protein n=1 Tax=Pseudonocardia sp. ICBG601 TaxID=2846759 RepID=UPI001CF6A879|nr:ADP-ribosylglycohydrolase family protein [Pseudonocardia sp. ICBG601]